jgi:hypothetical protein
MKLTGEEFKKLTREEFIDLMFEELKAKAEDPNLSAAERKRRRAEVKRVEAQLAERRKQAAVTAEKS